MLEKRLILQAGVIGEADLGSEVFESVPTNSGSIRFCGRCYKLSSQCPFLRLQRCSSEESGQRPNLFGCEALMMPLPVFREA